MQQFEVRRWLNFVVFVFPKTHFCHLKMMMPSVFEHKLSPTQLPNVKAGCLQVWRELFSPLHALSFGIGGDTTCNVLWRLQNGELENIRPKVSLQEWSSTVRLLGGGGGCALVIYCATFENTRDLMDHAGEGSIIVPFPVENGVRLLSSAFTALINEARGAESVLGALVQVVVLWVGTNNYQHTAEQVAGGILAIAELLRSRLPKAKIVVLVSNAST